MIGFLLGGLLGLAGFVFAILVWQSLPHDPVGRPARIRRRETGLHGRVSEWLYWDAPLRSPRTKNLETPAEQRLAQVGDRALSAVVGRVQTERQIPPEEAREILLKETRSPTVRAFLEGRMGRAKRLHAHTRYTGPAFLFLPWYYLVACIRYGHRHLYLDTLAAVLQEMRRT